MLYSPLTGGFYHPQIHGANIPSDAVEITDERHAELIAGQAAGQVIAAGPDGAPVLTDPPPPPVPAMAERRAATSIPKPDFCRALYAAQILTEESVVEAALGRLPNEFGAALAGLPESARVNARIAWATATSVNRMAPLFLSLLDFYAKAKGMTTAQAEDLGDTIFGIGP